MSSPVVVRAHGTRALLEFPDRDDLIARRVRTNRDYYERDLLEDLRRRARPGTLIDVGAHVGNHTVYAATVLGLRVVAIEANPATVAALRRNVELNRLQDRVRIVEAAAGARRGRARVEALAQGNSGMTRAVADPAGEVEVVRIDELELRGVSVIKVDVEGAELEVLRGAQRTIERDRPLLYVEAADERALRALERLVRPLGYRRDGRYAKTPTYAFVHGEPIRPSVAIMAHPRRRRFVEELIELLDAEPAVVWDRRDDRWDTGRRALLAADPAARHHLVIQDDALPCRDLTAGLARALEVVPCAPISLYCGRQRPMGPAVARLVAEARRHGSSWIVHRSLLWGVGLCFPSAMIPSLVEVGDRRPAIANYDARLSSVLEDAGLLTYYTFPSLVDHRRQAESPSLVPGRTGENRVAHESLAGSALGIEWRTRPVIDPYARRDARGVRCPVCGAPGASCGGTGAEVRPVDVLVKREEAPAMTRDPMVVVPVVINGRATRVRMRESEARKQGLLEAPEKKKAPRARNKKRSPADPDARVRTKGAD